MAEVQAETETADTAPSGLHMLVIDLGIPETLNDLVAGVNIPGS